MNTNANKSELDRILKDIEGEERESLLRIWQLSEPNTGYSAAENTRVDTVWKRVSESVENDSIARRSPPGRMLRHLATAAAVLIVAGAVIYGLVPVRHSAQSGQTERVSLADGSVVELNSESTLSYARWFGSRRSVHLNGEAFFSVAESGTPFEVNTFNARVTVLGTEFNVYAWSGSSRPQTVVSVTRGAVQVENDRSNSGTVVLEAGDRANVQSGTIHSATVPEEIERTVSWREGDLVFIDQPLAVVLEDVERRFGISLELASVQTGDRRVSLGFSRPSDAERVVSDLCQALGLQYRPTTQGFEIFAEYDG